MNDSRLIARKAFTFFWNQMWIDGQPWEDIEPWEREAWTRVVELIRSEIQLEGSSPDDRREATLSG